MLKGFTKMDNDKADFSSGMKSVFIRKRNGTPPGGQVPPGGVAGVLGVRNQYRVRQTVQPLTSGFSFSASMTRDKAARLDRCCPTRDRSLKKQDKNQKNLNKGAQKLLKDFPPGPK